MAGDMSSQLSLLPCLLSRSLPQRTPSPLEPEVPLALPSLSASIMVFHHSNRQGTACIHGWEAGKPTDGGLWLDVRFLLCLLDTYRSSRTEDGTLRRLTESGCWQSDIMSYNLCCSFSFHSDIQSLALERMDVEKRYSREPSKRDVDASRAGCDLAVWSELE